MKKITTTIVIVVLFFVNAEAKKIQGIIITTLDTMEVTLRINANFFTGRINYPAIQSKIKYIDKNGKKKRIYADKAKEVRFTYRGEDIRLLSRDIPQGLVGFFSYSRVFLRLTKDGPLKLFTYYSRTSNGQHYNATTGMWQGGGSSVREIPLLQKGEARIKKPDYFKFRKDMIEYLDDCPALIGKLKNKDFKRWNIEEMVSYYNLHCL